MTDPPDQSSIVVEVSRVVAYSGPPSHWRDEPIEPVDAGLNAIAWRFSGTAPVKLCRAAATCVLPPLPDPRFRVLGRTDFWLACEGLPSVVEVTRVRLACPRSVVSDPGGLADWAGRLESQSDVDAGTATSAGQEGRSADELPLISRSSDFVCVVEADEALEASLGQAQWCAVPSQAWRRELATPSSDFWVIRASSWRGRQAKLDASTVLFLFALVLLKSRVLTDTVVRSIHALSGPLGTHGERLHADDSVEWLAARENRLEVIKAHRTFLLAKLSFDQLRVVKFADADGPVYEAMLARSGSARLVSERERDFDSLTRLVSEAALHREVSAGLRRTTLFAKAIAVLGVLGTIAGVLQAVDRSEPTLPLLSEPSMMRFAILVGILSLLGMALVGLWLLTAGRRARP